MRTRLILATLFIALTVACGLSEAALVFERTAAGAKDLASHVLGLACRVSGWFGGLRDVVELPGRGRGGRIGPR